jgi:hypothetical protein
VGCNINKNTNYTIKVAVSITHTILMCGRHCAEDNNINGFCEESQRKERTWNT